jgi:hypothetical protein
MRLLLRSLQTPEQRKVSHSSSNSSAIIHDRAACK